METLIKQRAIDYLNKLIGSPLLYVLKSPDTELYDFGFGEYIEVVSYSGRRKKVSTYALHVLCRFKLIWRNGERRFMRFYEDTPREKAHSEMSRLIELKVRRVALSDENDLRLDFGDYWVDFATFPDDEESWRFFSPYTAAPHLVASSSWLDLQE